MLHAQQKHVCTFSKLWSAGKLVKLEELSSVLAIRQTAKAFMVCMYDTGVVMQTLQMYANLPAICDAQQSAQLNKGDHAYHALQSRYIASDQVSATYCIADRYGYCLKMTVSL